MRDVLGASRPFFIELMPTSSISWKIAHDECSVSDKGWYEPGWYASDFSRFLRILNHDNKPTYTNVRVYNSLA